MTTGAFHASEMKQPITDYLRFNGGEQPSSADIHGGINITFYLFGFDFNVDIRDDKTFISHLGYGQTITGTFVNHQELMRKVVDDSRDISKPFNQDDVEARVITFLTKIAQLQIIRHQWVNNNSRMVVVFKITRSSTAKKFTLRIQSDKTYSITSPDVPGFEPPHPFKAGSFNNSMDLVRCVADCIFDLFKPTFEEPDVFQRHEGNTGLGEGMGESVAGPGTQAELLYQSMSRLHARVSSLEVTHGWVEN